MSGGLQVNPGSTWRQVDGAWVQLTEGTPLRSSALLPPPSWLVELVEQNQSAVSQAEFIDLLWDEIQDRCFYED